MTLQTASILVIEDSDEDYEATVRAFRKAQIQVPLIRCSTGDEALDLLYERGTFQAAKPSRPRLVLLDLNLPGTDGRDVLRAIKSDPHMSVIPVVVLTTSSNPCDIHDCYQAGANTYIIKPVNLALFYETINYLCHYWLRVAIVAEY